MITNPFHPIPNPLNGFATPMNGFVRAIMNILAKRARPACDSIPFLIGGLP